MPGLISPTRSQVHVIRPLTNITVAYVQSAEGFVADRAFPNVPVNKVSDKYFEVVRGDFNRDDMAQRALSTESAGGGYRLDSTPTYICQDWAFHKDIDDRVRSNYDEGLDPERETTEFLALKFLIRREKLWASQFFVTSIWANEDAGVNSATPGAGQFTQWNRADSTPIEDIRAARTATKLSGGLRPNKLVLGTQVYDKLIDHPDVVGRVDRGQTPGGPAQASRDALAKLFDLDEVLIMDAIVNDAPDGQAEANAFIGGKNALLMYATQTPGLMTPTAGYTFSWRGALGEMSALSTGIKRFRMEHLSSDRLEINASFVQKLVSADLGYMFLNAVA